MYVAPDGTLSYTQAHSVYVPEGSVTTGWSIVPWHPENDLGTLSFEGGLIACPSNASLQWQVYGQIADFTAPSAECLGFGAVVCKLIFLWKRGAR